MSTLFGNDTFIPTTDFNDIEPIMDSIYGVITLSPFEKRIMSTKEMQRLRGIKQLGFVNLVYPDAEHSRFSHSIGVCHQAKKLSDQVSTNIGNQETFKTWRKAFSSPENAAEIVAQPGISQVERIIITAAALLHDLPHSPFSHEIETHNYNGKGIPVHDNFKENPVFFLYLFDKAKSDLAKLIDIYNAPFWELLKKDSRWSPVFTRMSDVEDGYLLVREGKEQSTINGDQAEIGFEKLPLLGVMIFELLFFEKPNMWVKKKDHTIVPNYDGINVVVNFENKKVNWRPMWDWFRPYRKDIVANTICADLLDYLLRDGRNTGILPSLDLKFFDRMTIVKAYPDKTDTLIGLSKLPDFCEHIVFDIFDHKRGVVRHSIITEIISFLQYRYLLAERVYNHRVVEGARTMLQEISRLLTNADLINVQALHSYDTQGFSPINDESFLNWVLEIEENKKPEIIKAKNLVRLLQKRRVFREVVIIDAIQDEHQGTFRGYDVNCKTLESVLLDDDIKLKILKNLEIDLNSYCKEKGHEIPNSKSEQIFTIGIRKFGKSYKVPRVLVARPLNNVERDNIEVLPLFDGKKFPAVNDRLESMQKSFDGLWKVYLFIHPFFHQKKFKKLHEEITDKFLQLLYTETNIRWHNSIVSFERLLPEHAIDVDAFIQNASVQKQPVSDFLGQVISLANRGMNNQEFNLVFEQHGEAIVKRLKKIKSGDKLLKNKTQQGKVIDELKTFVPQIDSIAAQNKEEQVIEQLVKAIEKALNENSGLF